MAQIYHDLWKRVTGRYIWKIIELISVIIFARLFLPAEFGYAFYVIAIISMVFPLFMLKQGSKDTLVYDNLLGVTLIAGIIGSIVFFAASYFFTGNHLPYMMRFAAVAFLLSMISAMPTAYFTCEKKQEKLYKANLVGQFTMLLITIALFFLKFGYQAILYGYLGFWLVKLIILWADMKIKIALLFPNFEIINELNISQNLLISVLRYGLLAVIPLFFSVIDFAYLYFALYISFFLYENVTVFLTNQLLPVFKSFLENQELFNLSLVRLLEYISFVIMPFTIIPLLLLKNIYSFILGDSWQIYDIIFILTLSGVILSVFEIPNLVLLAKEKAKSLVRIRVVHILFLMLFAILLGKTFGSFGIALSVFLSSILSSVLFMLASLRIIKMNIISISKDYFYIIFSAILTMLFLGLLKEWSGASAFYAVLILWGIGIVLFVASIYLINKDFLKRFVKFTFSMQGDAK